MNLVELKGIQKSFPEGLFGQRTVLDNIDLTVRQGDFVVLRGANGAGKSTLIKIILGLQDPDRGSVELFGDTPKSPEARLLLGTVFQEITPPNSLRVNELINLIRSYYPNPKSTLEILESVDLLDKQNAFPSDLAGGQKQRLYFAIALVGNPKLLILDEPTKNLDIEGQAAFWNQVEQCQQNGVTILMVTHIKSDQDKLQALATHIITLADGQLIYDKRPELVEGAIAPMPYDASSSTANAWNIFLAQTWAEILQLMRTPTYLAGVLLLSSLAVFIPSSEPEAIQPSMLFLSAFCLLTFSIDRLGKRIAIERVEGWLKLLRVTPLPPSLYIAAKLAMTMALLVVSLATIFGICIFKHGLEQSNMAWVKIWLGLLVGIIPFTLLGITLGYSVPPKALDSITGLLIPTAMFFSGQWPMPSPAYLQDITVVLPFFHYAQLIKSAAGILPINHLALSVAWLILYGILAGLMAKLAYQRDAVT